MAKAIIHHVYDSSFVDGPGNRMAVFFQGCNMNCWYCHNPETIGYCVHCGACLAECSVGALKMNHDKVIWDQKKCVECFKCEQNCPNQASPRVVELSVEDLAARVKKNRPFITGITCSGGECTLQKGFLIELFRKIKRENGEDFSCLLDSNGSVLDFEQESDLLSVVDGVMLDIKEADPLVHQMLTGQSNELVFRNARFLAEEGKLLELRTVVTGKNLHIKGTMDSLATCLIPYLSNCPITYRLIPFRSNGVRDLYQNLGTPEKGEMIKLAEYARTLGFENIRYT